MKSAKQFVEMCCSPTRTCKAIWRFLCCSDRFPDIISVHSVRSLDSLPPNHVQTPNNNGGSPGPANASPTADSVSPLSIGAQTAQTIVPSGENPQAQGPAQTAPDNAEEPQSQRGMRYAELLGRRFENRGYAVSAREGDDATEPFPELPNLDTAGLGINANPKPRRHSASDLDHSKIRSYQTKGIAGASCNLDEITRAGPVVAPHSATTGSPEGAYDSTRPTTATTGNEEAAPQKKSYQNDGSGLTWSDHAQRAKARGEPIEGLKGLTWAEADEHFKSFLQDPSASRDPQPSRSDDRSSKRTAGGMQETNVQSPVEGVANIPDLIVSSPEEAFARRSDEVAPAATKLGLFDKSRPKAKRSESVLSEREKAELEQIDSEVKGKENYSLQHKNLPDDRSSNTGAGE